jgi:hypothetical protein
MWKGDAGDKWNGMGWGGVISAVGTIRNIKPFFKKRRLCLINPPSHDQMEFPSYIVRHQNISSQPMSSNRTNQQKAEE